MSNVISITKLQERFNNINRVKANIIKEVNAAANDQNNVQVAVNDTVTKEDGKIDVNIRVLSVSENKAIQNKATRLKNLDISDEQFDELIERVKVAIMQSPREEKNIIPKNFDAKDLLNRVRNLEDQRLKFEDLDGSEKNKPLKIKIDDKINIQEQIKENNEKIFDRLVELGEVDAANYIHEIMYDYEKKQDYKYASEIQDNTNQVKLLSQTNAKIEEHLDELRISLREGQDTSIERTKAIEEELEEKVLIDEVSEKQEVEAGAGIFEALFGMIFGRPLLTLLKGAGGSILKITQALLGPALAWLWTKLSGNASELFKKMMSGALNMFNALRDRVNNFLDKTWKVFSTGYETFKKGISTTISAIQNSIKVITEGINKLGRTIRSIISNVPGLSRILGTGALIPEIDVDGKRLSDTKPNSPNRPNKPNSVWGKISSFASDTFESAKTNIKSGATVIKDNAVAAGRAVYGYGHDAYIWSTDKLKRVQSEIKTISSRVVDKFGEKFSNIPGKLSEHVKRTAGKVTIPSNITNSMSNFAKVLRAVPFLGQALAVGFAAHAAKSGWDNAHTIYGIPEDEVSIPGKGASAIAHVVKDLLWPIPINERTVALAALNLSRESPTKDGNLVKGNFIDAPEGDISQFESPEGYIENLNDPVGLLDYYDKNSQYYRGPELSDESSGQFGDYSDVPSMWPTQEQSSMPRVPDIPTNMKDIIASDVTFDESGIIGHISAKYESGGRGVHTISTGKGDPGGVSYGAYQIASKTGTMRAFLNSSSGSKYRGMFQGTQPGSDAFNSIYREIASKFGKEFHLAQHDFIKKTHYDPVESIARTLGIDTSNPAIKEALWSQSVQHGRRGNKIILENALRKLPRTTDELLRAIYTSRSEYVSGLSMPGGTKQSVINRYKSELADVLAFSSKNPIMLTSNNKLVNLIDTDSFSTESVENSGNTENDTGLTDNNLSIGNPFNQTDFIEYQNTTVSEAFEKLGIKTSDIVQEFKDLIKVESIPTNNKEKAQQLTQETISQTQSVIQEKDSEIINYVNNSLTELRTEISALSTTVVVNNDDTQTGEIFNLDNSEYTPGDNLKF